MFTRAFAPPTAKVGRSTITLSKSVGPNLLKFARTERAKEVGIATRTKSGDRAMDAVLGLLSDIDAAEDVIDALRTEAESHRRAIKALTTGELGPEPTELERGAAEAHGLALVLRNADPEMSVATEALADTRAALEEAADALEESLEVSEGRLEKAVEELLPKASKVAFAFADDFGRLMSKSLHRYLPPDWQAYLDPDEEYGCVTTDIFCPYPEDIAATVVHHKFARMLETELLEKQRTKRQTRRKLDALTMREDLREAHQ